MLLKVWKILNKFRKQSLLYCLFVCLFFQFQKLVEFLLLITAGGEQCFEHDYLDVFKKKNFKLIK